MTRSTRDSARLRLVSVDDAVQPIAVTRQAAATALGMSLTTFEERVQPFIGLIPCGRKRLVPVSELERWAEQNVEAPMAEQLRAA